MVAISVLLGVSAVEEIDAVRLGIVVTAFLLYATSSIGGIFLGFLFGLPRSRVVDQMSISTLENGQGGSATSDDLGTSFLVNSNLIKVSDWLTTIVIGLTLVNLREIVPYARQLSEALGPVLGGEPYSAVVGLMIVAASFLAGFILGFLWTSIRVRELFNWADHESRSSRTDAVGGTERTRKEGTQAGIAAEAPPGTPAAAVAGDKDPKAG